MIAPFSPPMGYDAHKVPIASNAQIGAYAEAVLGQYRPELLKTPGAVDGLHFLEYFLGLSVEYQDIFTARKPRILGCSCFSDAVLPVVDRSGAAAEVRFRKFREGTVIIDEKPGCGAERYSERFTQLHEAGHWLLHGFYFRSLPAGSGKECSFGSGASGARCVCSAEDIFGGASASRREKPKYYGMLEHQANVFASHFALPGSTVVPFAEERILALGYREGILEHQSAPEFDDEDLINLKQLLRLVSEVYGVSEKTAEIRLRELGLVRSVEYWDLWEKRHHADKNIHA